jgi:hypothetical protein
MKVRSTHDKLHLTLDRAEALALMAVIGRATGSVARTLPSYDQIADALEADDGMLRHTTIHKAINDAELANQIPRLDGLRIEARDYSG